jgi:hypothetical protein
VLLARLDSMQPSRATFLPVVLSSLLAGALAIGLDAHLRTVYPPDDWRFVQIGREYREGADAVEAAGWDEAARQIKQGRALDRTLEAARMEILRGRGVLDEELIPGEFLQLTPDPHASGGPEDERVALAAAMRGIAEGLRR